MYCCRTFIPWADLVVAKIQKALVNAHPRWNAKSGRRQCLKSVFDEGSFSFTTVDPSTNAVSGAIPGRRNGRTLGDSSIQESRMVKVTCIRIPLHLFSELNLGSSNVFLLITSAIRAFSSSSTPFLWPSIPNDFFHRSIRSANDLADKQCGMLDRIICLCG